MTTTYEVRTPVGALAYTSDNAASARRFVFANKIKLPGLMIEEVTVSETRRCIYKPRMRSAA